jgi:hypothetical protein
MYLILCPYKVLEFKDARFPVITKQVERGDSLIFVSNYCKYVDEPATVSRSFINDFTYATVPIITHAKAGCRSMRVVVYVPPELPLGTYYLHNKFVYKVNPLRTITIVHDSEEFEVVEEVNK